MGRQVSLHQCESVHLEQGSWNKLRGYGRPAPFGSAPSTHSLLYLLLTKQNDVSIAAHQLSLGTTSHANSVLSEAVSPILLD